MLIYDIIILYSN